jgi:hypothetical protein
MSSGPRYSFVATSRNDDHGGDILRRTQSWVTRLAEQCERHEVPCELVLVDWNPPKSRAPLSDVLAWPRGSRWFSARVLVAPPALHRELQFWTRLPMFQMIAKNVGIRRALGEFIIATNVDIIFSDEMFGWLKAGGQRQGRLYRSDRWDIPNEVQLELDIDILLQRARDEAIRRNLRDGTYVKHEDGFVNTTQTQFDSSFYVPLKWKLNNLQYIIERGSPNLSDVSLKLRDILEAMPSLRNNFFVPVLHTNGCGDFTMLSRADWFAFRGYPEWNTFSWAIDSVLIFQAHFNGIEIEELPPNIVHYHIEHDYGSGWTPEGSSSLWARLDQRGIPYIRYDDSMEIVRELQRNASEGQFTIYNELNWGYFDREVECHLMIGPNVPPRPPLRSNTGPLEEAIDLTVIADLPLKSSFCHYGEYGVDVTEDGFPEIAVVTAPSQWSYSLAFDLRAAGASAADYWLKVDVYVDSGKISVGALNEERTDFLVQAECRGPSKTFSEVTMFVKDASRASELIFRNANSDGEPARFRVRSVQILGEAETVGPRADRNASTAHRLDNERGAASLQRIASSDRETSSTVVPAEQECMRVAQLAEIRPGAPDVIVRILPGVPAAAEDSGVNCQAMIVLPGAAGAVLDLATIAHQVVKVGVHLHVLQGAAVIGMMDRASGELLVERREGPGAPLSQVKLDFYGTKGASALVIGNASPSGPTKLLLHRVEYQADG